jgi:hypothetical protein
MGLRAGLLLVAAAGERARLGAAPRPGSARVPGAGPGVPQPHERRRGASHAAPAGQRSQDRRRNRPGDPRRDPGSRPPRPDATWRIPGRRVTRPALRETPRRTRRSRTRRAR